MFAFFNDLHIDLNVAIEKRESFDAAIDRETISAQNIDFFGVAIDEKSDAISKENSEEIEVADDSTTDFDDVENDEVIDRDDEENDETEKVDDETDDSEICAESETTVFDFFACRVRICS